MMQLVGTKCYVGSAVPPLNPFSGFGGAHLHAGKDTGMTEAQIVDFEKDCYAYNNSVRYDMDAEWSFGLGDYCVYDNAKSQSEMWHWRLILGFVPAKYEYGMTDVDVPAGWTFGYQMKYNVDVDPDPYVYEVDKLLFPLTPEKHVRRSDAYDAMVKYAETVRKRIASDPCRKGRFGCCRKCLGMFPSEEYGKTSKLYRFEPWLKYDDVICMECDAREK